MISFSIDSKYKKLNVTTLLQRAAELTLATVKTSQQGELTIVLTSDAKIQKLNRQFRGESKSTDVLSFPAEERDLESGKQYLGDVIISVPRAKAQAEADHHSLEAELQLLTVHGVLHLLGHDHATDDERERMWAAQDQILEKLKLPIRSVQAAGRAH